MPLEENVSTAGRAVPAGGQRGRRRAGQRL